MAAGLGGLFLQFHQQVHHVAAAGAAVGNVAGLHQMGFSTGPIIFVVEQAGAAQQLDELFVVAVNIAHGNDPLDAAPSVLRGPSSREDEENDEGKGETDGTASFGGSVVATAILSAPESHLTLPISLPAFRGEDGSYVIHVETPLPKRAIESEP